MCKLCSKPFHTIVSLEKGDNWERFRITVHLPMVNGWFEQVRLRYEIQHKENDVEYAIFEADVMLETSALYYYYISYVCNGRYTLLKKESITKEQSITRQECFKLSVNFHAPDWAKGAIMYQILPDRFYKIARNPGQKNDG